MAEHGYQPGGDFGQGYLSGVVVAQPNVARGRRLYADAVFVEQLRNVIETSEPRGIKCRLGHGLKSESTGTALGRFRNARVGSDGKLRADLQLLGSSRWSPKGDLLDYVTGIAINSPADLGASALFTQERKAEAEFMARHQRSGMFRSPDRRNGGNWQHMRIAAVSMIDLVDEAALNPAGLFEVEPDPVRDKLLAKVERLSSVMPIPKAVQAVREGRSRLHNGQAVKPLIRISGR